MENSNKNTLKKSSQILSNIVLGVIFTIMIILALSMIVPIVWLICASFKSTSAFSFDPIYPPTNWRYMNYVELFQNFKVRAVRPTQILTYGYFEMMGNSLLIAVITAVMGVFIPAITAYIVSKYNFPGKSAIYTTAIIVMIIPIVGSMPSRMSVLKFLNIYNNLIPYLLFTPGPFGFNFLLLYGAFKGISWDYAEAAFIDGASHLRVMFTIMFPMMLPTFSTLFVMGFIGSWNDYMTIITWLPGYPNLASGMYNFQSEASRYGLGKPVIMAGFVVVMIPTVILYFCTQKLIMSNMRVGGLKG